MALYTKTPTELLYDAINRKNPVVRPLDANNATVAKLTADSGTNATVTVKGIQYHGYVGQQSFKIQRLDLALLFKGVTVIIDAPGVVTLHAALANLNAKYGTNFTPDDVVDRGLLSGFAVLLTAKPDSLQYTGEIQIRYLSAGYRLNTAIYQRVLDSYNHPITTTQLADGHQSGAMLYYAIDFTNESNLLDGLVDGELGSGQNYSSGLSAALVATTTGLGLPTWDYTQANVRHYPASIVPKANPAFDRVLVVNNIGSDLIGPLYLHYNQR